VFKQARWQQYGYVYLTLQKLKNSPSTAEAGEGIAHRDGDMQWLRRSQKSNVDPLKLYIVVRLTTLLVNDRIRFDPNIPKHMSSAVPLRCPTLSSYPTFRSEQRNMISLDTRLRHCHKGRGGTALISAAQGACAGTSLYHLSKCSLLCHLVWTNCVTSCINRYVACSRLYRMSLNHITITATSVPRHANFTVFTLGFNRFKSIRHTQCVWQKRNRASKPLCWGFPFPLHW
jgi:hypothetical protein